MPFSSNVTITNTGKNVITNRLVANTQPLPKYIQIGTGATSADRTADPNDNSLSTPVESRQEATLSQVTTDSANDTLQAVATITATAARAVDEAMIFDLSSGGNSFISATFNVINLEEDDSLQLTFKAKFQ